MKMRINKGGRPRQNRSSRDLGTPELIAKRIGASPSDPTMSTCPIDILLSRGIISPEAHDAAVYWGSLRKMVFGKALPPAVDLLQITNASSPQEFDRGEAEMRYREAAKMVQSYSRQSFTALENIVVYERTPDWLDSLGRHPAQREHFMTALGALLAWKRNTKIAA